ncbi:hypothetical protein BABINDRAFT_33077 [Babjeviella inositovora NRRL Y-12698]|uniref:Aminopeptidase P N-terminal domain-containing protein n=1 Tax=Babjeviella inositovora NRRL Y-12698 TaxID=984486 RepID=A0A1E3QWG7_9ASCO|nr:uncharacterized protein BABINDRAFT_33077 [Babjeviella inositovora NRRL Y-12698]ODQ82018.1 hypothetical protein BABINDRAFT_33077 [Babjeviella inositovora NRRL Y-12698]
MPGPVELQGKKYPAKQHAQKVRGHFLTTVRGQTEGSASFFLSGENLKLHPYSDENQVMRQNRYFYYLSGVNIPGSHVLYDLKADKSTLFLPEIDLEEVMWTGMPMSIEEAQKTFDVDEIVYVSEMETRVVAAKAHGKIFTTDVNEWNQHLAQHLTPGDKDFFLALDESRLLKDDYELALMRHAAAITDNSHLAVMSALPVEKNEGHIHAEFIYHSMRQGSKHQSYSPVCCAGPHASTLHYIINDADIVDQKTVLIDAGAEWSNYASDVTRCFPVDGHWTKEHLEIYEAVLDMQSQTMALIKPGVSWDDLHLLAHRVLIQHFLKLGIFKAEFSEQQLFDSGVSDAFFPHGLGHLLGMDTHDVGGRPNSEDPHPKLKGLRLRRTLQAGMVLTDEPGIYFSPFLLEDTLKEDGEMIKYINRDVVDKYWYIGGVRIEDDLLITETGYENFTKITKDPKEISKIVLDGIAKGRGGFHCIV